MATNVILATQLTPNGEKRVTIYCDIDSNTFYWSDDDGNIEQIGQEDDLTTIEENLATATASIATNEENIASATASIATNEENITTNADDIDTLEGYFVGATSSEVVIAVGGTFSFTNGVLTGYVAPE